MTKSETPGRISELLAAAWEGKNQPDPGGEKKGRARELVEEVGMSQGWVCWGKFGQ